MGCALMSWPRVEFSYLCISQKDLSRAERPSTWNHGIPRLIIAVLAKSKKPSGSRDKQVLVKLHASEMAELKAAADHAGFPSVSSFLRFVGLREARATGSHGS